MLKGQMLKGQMLKGQMLEGTGVTSNLQAGEVGDGRRGNKMLEGPMLEGAGVSSHLLEVGEVGGRRGWRWAARWSDSQLNAAPRWRCAAPGRARRLR
jgi:hypothetical protein